MLTDKKIAAIVKQELVFSTALSGGKGGQNVNKVETKVMVEFNVLNSGFLTDDEKQTIIHKFKKLTKDYTIKLSCDTNRTQLQNKKEVVEKFKNQLKKIFIVRKKRLATKPSKQSLIQKAKNKQALKDKKQNRKKIDY